MTSVSLLLFAPAIFLQLVPGIALFALCTFGVALDAVFRALASSLDIFGADILIIFGSVQRETILTLVTIFW